jgi:transcriptional regulator GlxA family with amidase domain
MDMMYAFIAHNWGEERAQAVADVAEYQRHTDPNDDPFARPAGV